MQEFEKHSAYPVGVKLLTGVYSGKVNGFHYDEIEVLLDVRPEKAAMTKVVEQLEQLLKGIPSSARADMEKVARLGSMVIIKNCDVMPDVVGERAEKAGTPPSAGCAAFTTARAPMSQSGLNQADMA